LAQMFLFPQKSNGSPCEAGVAPLSRPFFKPYMDTNRKLTNGIILSAELNQRLTA